MLKWRKTEDLDAKTVTKSWPAYGVLILAMGSMVFFGMCHPKEGGFVLPSGTAASVDGLGVTSMEFRRAHKNMSDQYQQQFKDQFDPVSLGLSQRVVDSLVESAVIYQESAKSGIYVTQDEIVKMISEAGYFKGEKGGFDPEIFQRYLKNQAHTEKSFTDELKRSMASNKLRQLLSNTHRSSEKVAELNYLADESKVNVAFLKIDPAAVNVTISQADRDKFLADGGEAKVKDYFEKNSSEFNQEKKVKARHILVTYKEARNASGEAAKRSKADAKTLAEKIAQEAKVKANDFAKLAEKYTEDPSGKSKGGDLGFFKKEQMVKEFSDVAFALKPGEVSSVVESPFGFHIIRVDTVQEARSVSLDEAKAGIVEKILAKEKKPQILEEKVKALHAALVAGKGEDLLQELNLSWKETGDFGVGARSLPGGLGPEKAIRNAVLALKNPGELSPQPIASSGSHFILKLKSKTAADVSKLDETKRKEMAESGKFMESYTFYQNLSQDLLKRYESEGKIYKNPEFVQYDSRMRGQPQE